MADELLIGRSDCVQALRAMLLALPRQESPVDELCAWSADFADWPLDEPAVLDALTQWLRPAGRRLTLLARDYEAVQRRLPRFAAWRRPWMHRIAAWRLADDQAEPQHAAMPAWLWSRTAGVRWYDNVHWRGLLVQDRAALVQWREQTDALLQHAEAGWPVSPLGL